MTKIPEEDTNNIPIIYTDLVDRRATTNNRNNSNYRTVTIRSELPYCISCQAYIYVATPEGVISEQQKAISDLVDRLGVEDDETTFMSLYIADDSDLFETTNNVNNSADRDKSSIHEPITPLLNLLESNDSDKNTWNEVSDKLLDTYNKEAAETKRQILSHADAVQTNMSIPEGEVDDEEANEESADDSKKTHESILNQDDTKPTFPTSDDGWIPKLQSNNMTQQNEEGKEEGTQQNTHLFQTNDAFITPSQEISNYNNNLDCKYCGSPCLDSNRECVECIAVLQGKTSATSGISVSEDKTCWSSNNAVQHYSISEVADDRQGNSGCYWIAENRQDLSDKRDFNYSISIRDDPMAAQYHHMPIVYEETPLSDYDIAGLSQGQHLISPTRNKRKSPKKKSKKKTPKAGSTKVNTEEAFTREDGAFAEYSAEDQQVDSTDQCFWWTDAIHAEEARLQQVFDGDNVTVLPGSTSAELEMGKENTTDEMAYTQDGSVAVEGRYQVGNKGTFDVLDSEPTWKLSSVNKFVSVSSDQLSSESISAQRKNVTFAESAFKNILDSGNPWDSLSFDSLEKDSIRQPHRLRTNEKQETFHETKPLEETVKSHKTENPLALHSCASPDYYSLSLIEGTDVLSEDYSGSITSNSIINNDSHTFNPMQISSDASSPAPMRDSINIKHLQERTSAEICRLLGSGWKLSVDEKCNKCLMPMMQKKPENISKCAACEIKNFQSNGNRYQSSQESQLGSSYIKSPLLSSALSASSKSSTQSTYSTSLSNLGIGKKLLENWSLVTSRTCECGGPIMRAPSSTNEECINPVCSFGKSHSSRESQNEFITSTINGDYSSLEMSGVELNASMDLVEAEAVNGYLEYEKSCPPNRISDTPGSLLENSIAKIQVGTNLIGFNRFNKAAEPLTEQETLHGEGEESDDWTAAEKPKIGNTETVESKLQAQIEMAEFLGSLF
eukprot:CAMPEP_0172417422 /NCGR_PEP_ID=MMETSP1064-20121228/3940_1 /TAXON_ID=202472 /ORGANISM="Aulacoseira subarctica , Strain CCAP 1002/5" /LENGTH=955 /DNA_ID=CAMNT_0013155745 /DNA_START=404 /DNA_END=3271 /DNA_ORIENTATION=+